MKPFFLFLFFYSLLEAKIVQTNRIEDVLSHLHQSTWVLFDLDDTLFEGENQLGRIMWYNHETEKLIQKGLSSAEAQKRFYPQWILSQTICPVRTVEPHTALIVAKAQAIAKQAMGLTTRHPPIAALTIEQLQKLNIDLAKKTPVFPSSLNIETTLYRNGVWFLTSFQSKSKAFVHLLAALGERPKRVVFVDDELHPLKEMEKILSEREIEFIGIHYTKASERPYNTQVAELQYFALPKILSDTEVAHFFSKASTKKEEESTSVIRPRTLSADKEAERT